MCVAQFGDEGVGYIKQVFQGDWDFNNSGGCSNFGMYDKNPAYCVNVL